MVPLTTVLFQPLNGRGLGHLSRLAAIALALRDKIPSARLPFLVDGGSHSLLEAASLPYFSLPAGNELYRSESWTAWPREERHSIMLNLAASIIRQLHPHAILFDTMPSLPVATAAHHLGVPMALCLRKVKDLPQHVAKMQTFYEHLNLILIPHAPSEVAVPSHLLSKTRFVGQIVRPRQSAHLGRDFPSHSKIVVITAGGGGYPNIVDYYNCALAAFASSRTRNPDLVGILITGPLFQDWWKLRVVDGVRVIPFDPHLTWTLAAANLTICRAGYNTIAEVMHLGVPTICVPANTPWDDGFERAEQAAASNPNFHICRTADVDQLSHLIDACIQAPSPPRFGGEISSMGATRAAEALLELITERSEFALL